MPQPAFAYPHNAWVGGELSLALLRALVKKGVLTEDEGRAVLDEVIEVLEKNPAAQSRSAAGTAKKIDL